ncbi:MAG: trigger factor family protein [Bacteroidia bacterium]
METHLSYTQPYLVEGKIYIPASQYKETYESQLRQYRKNLALPGFRPGSVPFSYVQQKYGKALLQELLTEKVTEALKEFLGGLEKLIGLPYLHHEPQELTPNAEGYTYQCLFLAAPESPLPLPTLELTSYQTQPTEEDIPLLRKYFRLLLGTYQAVETLPDPPLPENVEFLVILKATDEPTFTTSFFSLTQPLYLSVFLGKKLQDTLSLPKAALSPHKLPQAYLDLPETLTFQIHGIQLYQLADTQLLQEKYPELTEHTAFMDFMRNHLQRQAQRLLQRSLRQKFFASTHIQVPDALWDINYNYYLHKSLQQNGHLLYSKTEYAQSLLLEIWVRSHEATFDLSDEVVRERIWESLKENASKDPQLEPIFTELSHDPEKKTRFLQALEKAQEGLMYRARQKFLQELFWDKLLSQASIQSKNLTPAEFIELSF